MFLNEHMVDNVQRIEGLTMVERLLVDETGVLRIVLVPTITTIEYDTNTFSQEAS